jgi:hypothetical protein
MVGWVPGFALLSLLAAVQLDLDCARPAAARNLIGQTKLSEIEWAEDVSRAAMWEAFGRCAAAGPRAQDCRDEERKRFEADLDRQKVAIEAQYQRMLEEFEQRCQASIT